MRRNVLHIILELIVDIGFLILGVTILTMLGQNIGFPWLTIGSLVLAIGVLEVADFFTWKFATRRRSIQSLVAGALSIALGAFFMIGHNIDPKSLCIIWGICSIAFSICKIATGVMNLSYQPLINGVKIILAITEIVFSILLIAQQQHAIPHHMLYLGIALVVEAVTLFIEFVIHRYQNA